MHSDYVKLIFSNQRFAARRKNGFSKNKAFQKKLFLEKIYN